MDKISDRENGSQHYVGAIIVLHWLMLLLFIGAYASIEASEVFPEHSRTGEMLISWHYQFGYAIFLLVWLRLGFRLLSRVPPADPGLPAWMLYVARGMHLLLYLLMIFTPLAGWLMLGAEGNDTSFLGIGVPNLIGSNESLAEIFEETHEVLGSAGYFLIGLHTAAALFHHYVLGDNTMRRILPFRTTGNA